MYCKKHSLRNNVHIFLHLPNWISFENYASADQYLNCKWNVEVSIIKIVTT